jgi:hypothetical protein
MKWVWRECSILFAWGSGVAMVVIRGIASVGGSRGFASLRSVQVSDEHDTCEPKRKVKLARTGILERLGRRTLSRPAGLASGDAEGRRNGKATAGSNRVVGDPKV